MLDEVQKPQTSTPSMQHNMSAFERGPHHQHAFVAILTPRPAQYYPLLHQGVRIPNL